jgi:cephalosporin-C deacetylase-like acetyl esterase
MQQPDDFGLTPVQTLARVGDTTPGGMHAAFWSHWRETMDRIDPEFSCRAPGPTPDSRLMTWRSLGGVWINGLLVGDGSAGVGLIVLHGYTSPPPLIDDAPRWKGLADAGVAVLLVRVRGYGESSRDTGDLTSGAFGYVTRGLDPPLDTPSEVLRWVIPGAVADVTQAIRGLRQYLGERAEVYLRGESFGAGLGVIAGAVSSPWGSVQRMALGLPSLGDWTWRVRHRALDGAGRHVAEFLRQQGVHAGEVVSALRLADAVVHAPGIECPVLCKLACLDDVVPAPSAAAVFNALGTPRALKWRYVVRYGHFDGGLRDARAHARFERLAGRFLDPGMNLTEMDAALEECGSRP